jgi:uncharacterized protein YukE
MSMDEQYAEMRRFTDALNGFNRHLKESMRDLRAQHEHVNPYWQDEMRRTYDSHWEPLNQQMKLYLEREGPAYLDFLHSKIRSLEAYLYG